MEISKLLIKAALTFPIVIFKITEKMPRRRRTRDKGKPEDSEAESDAARQAEADMNKAQGKKSRKKKEIKPYEWTRVVGSNSSQNTRIRIYNGLQDLLNFENDGIP